MPKKGTAKFKQLKKNREKKKKKAQQQQQQNEAAHKKQQIRFAKQTKVFYEKQKEEIDTLSMINNEVSTILSPTQSKCTFNHKNLNLDKEKEKYSNIFDIQVVPHPGEISKNHCSIILRVRFPHYYPDEESPLFELNKPKNVNKTECASLLKSINNKALSLLGSEVIFEVEEVIKEFLQQKNDIIDKKKQRDLILEQPSKRLHANRHQRAEAKEAEKKAQQKRIIAQKQKEQLLLQKKLIEKEKAVAIGIEEEEEKRNRFLQSKSTIKKPKKDNKILLLLVHLLKKFSAWNSFTSAQYTKIFGSLINEIFEVGINGKYLNKLLNDELGFKEIFKSVFKSFMNQADVKDPILNEFWCPNYALNTAQNKSHSLQYDYEELSNNQQSRYHTDYEEIEVLGSGGFGRVLKCKHRLDGRFYAVKMIPIKQRGSELEKVLREVTTLSRMQGPYILRYYSAWFEGGDKGNNILPNMLNMQSIQEGFEFDNAWNNTLMSYIKSYNGNTDKKYIKGNTDSWYNDDTDDKDDKDCDLYLYLCTGYCEETLRDSLMESATKTDPTVIWRRFRQILEGLAYIHELHIIHRDLKPTNIFINANDEIRIGDFGLATFNNTQDIIYTNSSDSHIANSDLTSGIGTLLYISPEQRRINAEFKYNAKVDMYALGIIFFEMWYPFSTAMERVKVIKDLRQSIFPSDFKDSHPRQVQIIEWLLKEDPSERPSAMELLSSSLIPPNMEDEYLKDVLRTVSNPNSVFYGRVVDVMFKSANRMSNTSIDVFPVTQSSLSFNSVIDINSVAMREETIHEIKSICCNHGGIPIKNGIFEPFRSRPSRLQTNIAQDCELLNKFICIDSSGLLLGLRSDLKVSLARYITAQNIERVTTYCIDYVYDNKAQPKLCADFDIIDNNKSVIAECESILVCNETLKCMNVDGDYEIRINDAQITVNILKECGIKDLESIKKVSKILSTSHQNLNSELKNEFNLSSKQISKLTYFILNHTKFEPETFKKLTNILRKRKHKEIINRLREIYDILNIWKVDFSHFTLDLSLMLNDYYNDIQFCGLYNKEYICIGGRYDSLLQEFDSLKHHGVGVSIYLEKIIKWKTLNQQNYSKIQRIRRINGALNRTNSVFVCSHGTNHIIKEARLELVSQLWANGITAIQSYIDSPSIQEQIEQMTANKNQCQWIVKIEKNYDKDTKRVKMKNVTEKKNEIDICLNEISSFFLKTKYL